MANKNPTPPPEETRFKKGQSGNPAGRPRGDRNRATEYTALLDLVFKDAKGNTRTRPFGADDEKPLTVRQMKALAVIKKAVAGDVHAVRYLDEVEFGKIPDIITGDPENPIQHQHSGKVEIELTGQALIDELERRGLPTAILEE